MKNLSRLALLTFIFAGIAHANLSDLLVDNVGDEKKNELPKLDRMDFEAFYLKAIANSVKIADSEGSVAISKARMKLADALAWPQVNVEVLSGPSPRFSGDALSSETDYGEWGVALMSRTELIQPLYTFGALGKLRKAAQAAYEADQGRHGREQWQLRESIAKLYFGYQLAFELRELSRDLLSQLESAMDEGKKLRRRKAKGAPSLTDLERLNVFLAELTARFDEAQKYMDLAKLGMAVEIGEHGKAILRWRRASLKQSPQELKELNHYCLLYTSDAADE